jgi:hypothetical protein
MGKWLLAGLILLTYSSCLTLDEELARTEIPGDAVDCFKLALSDVVPIRISLESPLFGGTEGHSAITLTYEGSPDLNQESTSTRTQIVNLYFIVTGSMTEKAFLPCTGRLIINIWNYDPSAQTKTCHQWRLNDLDFNGAVDNVEAEIITENEKNTVTDIQTLQTSAEDRDDFSQLFADCIAFFLRRLNLRSLDELFHSPASNLLTQEKIAL